MSFPSEPCTPQYFTYEDKILVYIDNSNIFINTKLHAATKVYQFQYGVKEDFRARIDIGKLIKVAGKGRELLRGKLYGSEPPLLDTVWKAIREKKISVIPNEEAPAVKGVEVSTSRRSTWNNREKISDTALTADAVEDLITYSQEVTKMSAVIFFSGDRDILPALRKALKYGWNVEIWSYKNALNDEVKKEKKQTDKIQIHHIDDHFENVAFSALSWRKRLPRDRTLLLRFLHPPKDEKKTLKSAVISATKLFHLPVQARFVKDDELALVSIVSEGFEGKWIKADYNFNHHVWTKAEQLKGLVEGCNSICTWLSYLQEVREEDFEFWSVVDGHEEEEEEEGVEMEEEDFVPVIKKEKKNKQLYTDKCDFRYRCKDGKECRYAHSDLEREYFKIQPSAQVRKKYKRIICHRYETRSCKYLEKSYLCSFAHGVEETTCIRCKAAGVHWSDECDIPY